MKTNRKRSPAGIIGTIGAMLILLVVAVTAPARAAIITVDTLDDEATNNGNCSLREAVIAANTNMARDNCPAGTGGGMDYIWVLLAGTISLDSNLPLLEKVEILGGGRDAPPFPARTSAVSST